MEDLEPFGRVVLAVALVGLLAVQSNRLSERLRVPAPMFFFGGAAVVAELVPALHGLPFLTVERLVTIALVMILFDGGLHIGPARLRAAAATIATVGVVGTFLTAAALGALAHVVLGASWWISLLIGTALAPTDPAVVFSVLGRREVSGHSGTVLEGESGANDPVGIALMTGLLGAGGITAASLAGVAGTFVLQMLVGGAVGVLGGRLLLVVMRRVPLPSEGLYPLRTIFAALALYGCATLLHGSGFLAVFVAGILLGDARAPYKREIERFHSALASLGEIVAFIVLGLTVDLTVLARSDVWVPGLVLGAALAFVVRPLCVGLCLLPFDLARNEKGFVMWAGLKGAVPILLGDFLLDAGVPGSQRWYGIVVVVVVFSVMVQGTSIPAVADLLRVPMRSVDPEPWALGVRLAHEPQGVYHLTIEPGSPADGSTVGQLTDLSEDVWVSFVVRDSLMLPVRGDTELHAGDDVLVLATPELRAELRAAFGASEPG